MSTNSFIEVLKELKTTNSNKDKEAILTKYKNDTLVMGLLELNLNPYKMFYVRKLPTIVPTTPSGRLQSKIVLLLDLLNDLNTRKYTGNAAKDEIKKVFGLFNQEEIDAYSKVLLKKPIGVGASTVNKVWPDLIPTFEVMKAPTELPDLSKLKYPLDCQIKYDGFRALYIPNNDDKIIGASGLPIKNERIVEYFSALQNVSDYVLDGEIYSHEHSFEEIESILNSKDKEIPKSFKYIAFDYMSLKDWDSKQCKETYEDRLRALRECVQSVIGDRKRITDVPSDIVNNSAEAVKLYKKYLKDGYEGVMLKNPLGYYQWKRCTIKSGEIYKVKPFESVDVPIVGFYEGEGESNKGTLGGIVIDLGNNLTCNVGSGFTDSIGKEIWNNQSKYLGKMVEIVYFEKTEEGSLRHPRFKRFRTDKDK